MFKDEQAKGFLFAFLAFLSWGAIFPIYFSLYENVGSYEILIHRIIWSAVFMGLYLTFRKEIGQILRLLSDKRTRNALFLSGCLISFNWWIYVYAVGSEQILEASLGYFINPLMNMLLGALVLKERLNGICKLAIAIVFAAVLFQIYSLGSLPLIAIFLPLSFALYALVRKKIRVQAMHGLFIETLLVLPFSLAYFAYIFVNNQSHFEPNFNGFLMVFSGILTIFPLVAFNAATTRISLTSLGFMQYLSPTLAALVAVVIFSEPLGANRAVSFALIWLAIGIVSFDLIIKNRRKNG